VRSIKSSRKQSLPARRGGKGSLTAEEKKQPLWHYLSFDRFLGAVIVEARSERGAIRRATNLDINPGGDIMCIPLNADDMKRIPADLRNRLLSEAEVRRRLDGKSVME
jgi:hypothetical protein